MVIHLTLNSFLGISLFFKSTFIANLARILLSQFLFRNFFILHASVVGDMFAEILTLNSFLGISLFFIKFIKVFLKLQNGEWQSFFLAKRIIDPETGRYKVYIISYPSIQFYPSDSNPLSFPSFSKALSFLKSLT